MQICILIEKRSCSSITNTKMINTPFTSVTCSIIMKQTLKKLPKREDVDYHQYCKEMLELHIKVLRSLGKIVDYVYINNAEVSRWLCGNEEDKTFERLCDTYVFYGCILSGGRMDSFSNKRLKDEIKSVLKL